MTSLRSLFSETDLVFGLILSVCLGSSVGFVMDHHLSRLIVSSGLGATILLLYLVSYSISAIWMVGLPQGLVVVAAFVWSILLSSAL